MRWSVKIARLLGIDVKIHVTFLLGLLLIGGSVYAAGGHHFHDVVEVTALVCAVFACVLLHEFGHALAAAHYGIQTVDITLLPVGGVARLETDARGPVAGIGRRDCRADGQRRHHPGIGSDPWSRLGAWRLFLAPCRIRRNRSRCRCFCSR